MSCRAIVLAAEGKHFSAGADFASAGPADSTGDLYRAAVRLFRTRKPIVAAIQGAAIGGGLGVAMAADFRIAAPEARFSANFARLGFHHGFGLSVTLPAAVGGQHAAELLYTGRRITGDDAAAIGLVDRVASLDRAPGDRPRLRRGDRRLGAARRAVDPGDTARRSRRPRRRGNRSRTGRAGTPAPNGRLQGRNPRHVRTPPTAVHRSRVMSSIGRLVPSFRPT